MNTSSVISSSAENKFDLLPLLWWENPWIIGTIVLISLVIIITLFCLIRFLRARRTIILKPLDQWLFDLYTIKQTLQKQQTSPQHSYSEMIRIIREYAHDSYGIALPSRTDEEFIHDLTDASTDTDSTVPEAFLSLVHHIARDAYQVKFAKTVFPTDYIETSLHAIIQFFEQEKTKSDSNIKK